MIYIILILSLVTSLKSIFLSEFYNNYLMFSIYPLELALLSFNNSLSDIIIKWIVNGLFNQDNEIEYIDRIENYKEYGNLISWILTYVLFNCYILCKYRRNLNRYIFISYQLKFLIINFISLFLWSFNILFNYEDISIFVLVIFNVYIFNFITFWFQGIIFNFIFGEKMYIYRKKYDFLIKYYNPKYKYFTLILQSLKSLTFIYMIIYNLYEDYSDYVLIILNTFSILIYLISKNIYINNKLNYYLIILHLISILLIVCSILDKYFEYNYIIKYCILVVNIILVVYFNYNKIKRINGEVINNRDIEMDIIS